jgi:hypothetical protein
VEIFDDCLTIASLFNLTPSFSGNVNSIQAFIDCLLLFELLKQAH